MSGIPPGYRQLDAASVPDAVRAYVPDAVTAEEIGDGNLNLIFRVRGESGTSVIVKQALPYLRVVGEAWPLTLERARIERDALETQARLAPDLVPHLLGYDAGLAAIVMEDLVGYEVWRGALNAMRRYPHASRDVARFCAQTLLGTSDLLVPSAERKRMIERAVNPELCAITENLVFTAPYWDDPSNEIEPHIAGEVAKLWSDVRLLERVAELRFRFRTSAEALIHGDLHTGSVMVAQEGTRVIDPEFAFMGPMGFDTGAVVGNLAIAHIAHRAQGHDDFAALVASDARAFWGELEESVARLWPTEEPWRERFTEKLLDDTARFGGAKMIRRIIGLAQVTDVTGIANAGERRRTQLDVLAGGRALIVADRFVGFSELWATATLS